MMPRDHGQYLPRPGDFAGVDDVCGEPGVAAVQRLLGVPSAYIWKRICGKIWPRSLYSQARVKHAPVIGHGGEDRMDLVEPHAAERPSVGVGQVEVAHVDPIAVDRLATTCRTEQDVAVGQVYAFVIGMPAPR